MSHSPIFSTAAATWRALHAEWTLIVEGQYLAAEEATRGNLLNKRGRVAKIDPFTLFSGPAIRAHAYASEELLEHWQTHPRLTFAEYEHRSIHTETRCAECGEAVA